MPAHVPAESTESPEMNRPNHAAARTWRRAAAALAVGVVLAAGGAPAAAQQAFASPEAAAAALVDAIATSDADALRRVLGSDWRRVVTDPGVDRDDVYQFLGAWSRSNRVVRDGADRAHLEVGSGWTLPVPIVQRAGAWRFDTRAGADEMRTRRIGRNELSAMQAALAYGDAQRDYARADRNGDGVLEYAQRIVSTPGRRDGLYWAALPGEPESPLGPRFGDDRPGDEYLGYRFRPLTAQGPDAPGGAYDYRIRGRQTAGFALVAWPARYGDTGVMTFMVSHDGQLYEKNLGPGTDAIARSMTRFNPDPSWRKVMP
jgi:hypothetical protein